VVVLVLFVLAPLLKKAQTQDKPKKITVEHHLLAFNQFGFIYGKFSCSQLSGY